jgi:putative ABC transport system permease protein
LYFKDYLGFKLEAVSAATGYSVLRRNYETSLWLLLAIAGLVLLIACTNLANLLLARASARERELAVRQALGASRARLVRQLLVESLLLAFIGAALGALLAQSLSRFLVSFLGSAVVLDLSVDWGVLGFAAALAALACILFGLMPAVRATRIEPGAVMKAGARELTASRERFSLRRALVVVQVALSLVLLAGALLFTRSLNKLLTVEMGFQRDGVLITRASIARLNPHPSSERALALWRELRDRLKALPGVEAATDMDTAPLTGGGRDNLVWLDGTAPRQKISTNINRVGSDYFKTLRTPLVAGRDFDGRDAANTAQVAIVNEALARKLLPSAQPAQVVGHRFWIEATPDDPETLYEIVGLAKDTKFRGLREELSPLIFLAGTQEPRPATYRHFLLRSSLPRLNSRQR